MNFLLIGDVVGRSGRNAIQKYLPEIQKNFKLILQSLMEKTQQLDMASQAKYMKTS